MENFKINNPSASIHFRKRMAAFILPIDTLKARWKMTNYTQPKQLILDL